MPETAIKKVYDLAGKRVFIAGHRGMVGSAVERKLAQRSDVELLKINRNEVDLRDQAAVFKWIGSEKPDVVLVAAATVGGIIANSTRPAEFIYDNLA